MTDSRSDIDTPANGPVLGKIYLHLCSGEVLEIGEVSEIALTDRHLIVTRGRQEAVVIERSTIYYSCSLPGAAPSAY